MASSVVRKHFDALLEMQKKYIKHIVLNILSIYNCSKQFSCFLTSERLQILSPYRINVKSSSNFLITKRFSYRVSGALLLAIPFCGLTSQLPRAQAQPVQTPPAKKNPVPLTPEKKEAIAKALSLSKQERVCKMLVDLKVENATFEDVVSRLKQVLPAGTLVIDLRDANPIRVSFELKQTKVGDVLTYVAGLAGNKLFVSPDGLVVSSLSKLSDSELQDIRRKQYGEWSHSSESGGGGWSSSYAATTLFTQAIAQEATGTDADHLPAVVTKTTFGDFSPESQSLLREMASWMNDRMQRVPGSVPLSLDAASPITVDTSKPDSIIVSFTPGVSSPNAKTLYIQNMTVSPMKARP